MRNDLIFAAVLLLAAALACLCLAPSAPGPARSSATQAADQRAETEPCAVCDPPLSDLVATMPPEPRRPEADAAVRVILPPPAADQSEVLYCSPPLVGEVERPSGSSRR